MLLLLLPELVSGARWKKPAWSEILLAIASLLPERETFLQSAKGLKGRDTSVTVLPRSMSGEGAARCPGEEKDSLALLSGNG